MLVGEFSVIETLRYVYYYRLYVHTGQTLYNYHEVILTLSACARGTVVCLCVYLSVTTLAATYLIYTSKIRCPRVLYGIFQIFNVWLLLKMLCFKVLASFADHHSLPRSLMSTRWTKEPAMASFLGKEYVQLAITSITQLTHY